MKAKVTSLILLPLCVAVTSIAQQPNSGYATMTINGAVGPPYPILTNVRTSLPAVFTFSGATNQPYAVFQGLNLQVGAAFLPASNSLNSVDLALSPFPVLVIDGFTNPVFNTGPSGTTGLSITLPPAGSPPNGVPLGLMLALQAAVADPFSSIGLTLTAATKITVTQGPTITYYNLGDAGTATVSTAGMQLPYYGINYTTLYVNADGYVCFGTNVAGDFTPTDSEFNTGPPRIAAFWCDLDQGQPNSIKVTVDQPQGGGTIPGYVRVDYINVQDWTLPTQHTFWTMIQTDGYLELGYPPTNNASQYDELSGIGPGNSLGMPQPQKNFVGASPNPPAIGPGILTTPPYAYLGNVNENFFEWFGIISLHAYYQNPYNNPYDLLAITLHFQPSGSGSLPGSTNRYTLY